MAIKNTAVRVKASCLGEHLHAVYDKFITLVNHGILDAIQLNINCLKVEDILFNTGRECRELIHNAVHRDEIRKWTRKTRKKFKEFEEACSAG